MTRHVVLLVDPEEHDHSVVKSVLEAAGYDVRSFIDADRAREAFNQATAQAVVTTHPLPMADGEDFATAVKERFPQLPVVGMIRRGMREVARDAVTHCCDTFLSKPVDPELLISKLRELMPEQLAGPATEP